MDVNELRARQARTELDRRGKIRTIGFSRVRLILRSSLVTDFPSRITANGSSNSARAAGRKTLVVQSPDGEIEAE